MSDRDRCPSRVAQALLLGLALAACGELNPPRPAAPRAAPARDVAVRTGRFSVHANAYVDFYAWSLESHATLDQDLVLRLGACPDDRCAREALSGVAGVVSGDLDAFLADGWAEHEIESRRILGLAGSPLMSYEDAIAPVLATQIGRVWPDEPIAVYLARGAHIDPSGREGPVIDTHGECFEHDALLECLFTRAVEVLLRDSELGRAMDDSRAALDADGREATRAAVPCVAALAADVAVTAADARFQPTRRFAAACAPPLRAWLSDAWAKRMRGDGSARDLGAALVQRMAELGRRREGE